MGSLGEGHGTPLQCSCLENPRAGGAWRAAVYGVPQSRTRLSDWAAAAAWAHYVADNVLSIYYLFTFLNPHKKTIWDYFHFWDKRSEVWASQLISDKAEIKSEGFPRLHRPCALKLHTSPRSLNSNVCKGQSVLRIRVTGWKPFSDLLAFFCQLTFDRNLGKDK